LALPDGVKLIVFDFDQTLSCIHVFKTLAGWSRDAHFQVPRPYAMTERGQIRRVSELSQLESFKAERGGFACAAFGGEARVEQLRDMLERLTTRGVNLVICTKGLVGTVRKCLYDLGLLGFFSEVYGNVGDNYGETAYDQELARSKPSSRELQFLSRPENGAWRSKDKLILQLASRAGLSREQAVLVEDDAEEIRRATPVCRTLWIKEAAGMTSRHCASLLQLVEDGRRPPSGEDLPFNRSSDAKFSEQFSRFEARDMGSRGSREINGSRDREFSNSRGTPSKFEQVGTPSKFEQAPTSADGNSRLDLEISRLSLDDDGRPPLPGRRSKSCADAASKVNRRAARPASRGSHSRTLQAAGSRMMATASAD
jgi:phosphoglycolate phosphatase-like HAD superfamily hydrolase